MIIPFRELASMNGDHKNAHILPVLRNLVYM